MSRLLARGAECWATVGAEAKQGAIPRLAVAANRRASELVAPLAHRVVRLIAASEVVPADETPMPVQDDRKRPYIWTFVAGTLVACRFSMTRSGDVVDTGKATPSRCVVRDRGSVQQADGVLALVAADAAELSRMRAFSALTRRVRTSFRTRLERRHDWRRAYRERHVTAAAHLRYREGMRIEWYQALADTALAGKPIARELAQQALLDPDVEVIHLLSAAYRVRIHHWGKAVHIHVINNAQNGHCPEDCSYCSQAKSSTTDIEKYPLKEEEEILEEAGQAFRAGAFRYCMVFAGRGPSERRTQQLASVVRKIKALYNIEVCVSAGLLDQAKARVLKEAGVDRYNHNLNTSRENYPNICSTHTYDDRLATLHAAREQGLDLCSGLIVGMGESSDSILDVAEALRRIEAKSIPVNFLLPFEGTPIGVPQQLTPEYCLRVLSVFRFMNPSAELRISAGREFHLRSQQPFALYAANSLFLDGYLNSKGAEARQTLRMIQDAGFHIVSDVSIDDLLSERAAGHESSERAIRLPVLKNERELRPTLR